MDQQIDKKRYIIHCDLEGVSGVVNYDQVNPSKPLYEHGRQIFMAELNCLVESLGSAGADAIYTYDHHYFGINIDVSKIPSYVKLICGKPLYRNNWLGDESLFFTGAILLGLHSKAGTPHGLLAHSYEHDIKDIRINDLSVGEICMEAAIAGDFDVPVLLITGDSKGIEEAKQIIKNIESVIVKESIGAGSALCYPLENSLKKIKKAAEKIVNNPPQVNLFKFDGPVRLEVELYQTEFLKKMRQKYKGDFKDRDDVIIIKKDRVVDAWSDYILKKLSVL